MSAAPVTSSAKAAYEEDPGKSNVYAEGDDLTDSDGTSRKGIDAESGVHRGLSTRHLSLLAIGGVIGPGLLVVRVYHPALLLDLEGAANRYDGRNREPVEL